MSVTTLQIPARDDHDDEPYQAKVWVLLRRATLAEIGRHVAMRRRSIARLTVLLAEAHGDRKQSARIEHAIDRHFQDCAELDELVQAAAALGAQPDDVIGKVLVPRAVDELQAVRW